MTIALGNQFQSTDILGINVMSEAKVSIRIKQDLKFEYYCVLVCFTKFVYSVLTGIEMYQLRLERRKNLKTKESWIAVQPGSSHSKYQPQLPLQQNTFWEKENFSNFLTRKFVDNDVHLMKYNITLLSGGCFICTTYILYII